MRPFCLRIGLGLIIVGLWHVACGPKPTVSIGTTQRATPFFRVLVYEVVQQAGTSTTILVIEDEAGTCFITSGVDGGVMPVSPKTCEAAKRAPLAPPPPVKGFDDLERGREP